MRNYWFIAGVSFLLVFGLFSCSQSDPASVEDPPIINLNDPNNRYDYIIVAPDAFAEELEVFAALKENAGLQTVIATLPQIYNQFPGDDRAAQIRDFISYALSNWQAPAPRYLLLAGDVARVPTFRLASRFANAPTVDEDSLSLDEPFSINQNEADQIPDIALGRWPAANIDELTTMMAKSLYFETQATGNEYTNELLLLVDGGDDWNEIFENYATELTGEVVQFNNLSRIDIRPESSFAGTQEDFLTAVENGAIFLHFVGLSSRTAWSRSDFFNRTDVNAFTRNQRYFIHTGQGSSYDFDDPGENSLIEEMLLLPGGGAVASVAPVGLVYAFEMFNFGDDFYTTLFEMPGATVGDIFLAAKIDLLNRVNIADHTYRRYSLLGDPALPILVQ